MTAAHAVATKNARSEAAASRNHKNTQPVSEMIPGTRTGLLEEQFLVQRKENACACGGGCPRCALQAKRAVSRHADPLEREGDVVADRVVHPKAASFGARPPEPPVQRQAEAEEEKEEEESLQGKFESVQRQSLEEEEEEVLQGKFTTSERPVQHQGHRGHAENRTGMPGPLKAGLEALSGMDLSRVRVHRNSSKPAQVDALAYTQGQDIHVGPGQEKHLPHEGWHAVQQMQGRVKPTMQAKGVSINDDKSLEREADVMGTKALQVQRAEQATQHASHARSVSVAQRKSAESAFGMPVQRQEGLEEEEDEEVLQGKSTPSETPTQLPVASGFQFDTVRIPVAATSNQRNPTISSLSDPFERESDEVADEVMRMTQLAPVGSAPAWAQMGFNATSEVADGDSHELEADRTANEVVRRLGDPHPGVWPTPQAPASGMNGLGAGRPMSAGLRRRFEGAFNWDFSGVRLHTGPAAADVTAGLGARAFTRGHDVAFGSKVDNPEGGAHRRLLAHELTHVVQQDLGAGATASPAFSSLSPASPTHVQAAPVVTAVATSAAELGVGGRDITATATVAGRGRLTWTINPGGAAPAGVRVIGRGRRVRIRAAQPGGGAVVGGVPFVIRAELTGSVPPDGENSPPVMPVQVVSATYTAAPPLVAVPSLIPGAPPANTAEPNRDGIAGNTAVVNAVTAPAGRPVRVVFRRSLGATVAGNIITPGRHTGNINLRITDAATRARINETIPSAVNPPVPMATMVVNAVPTRVRSLTNAGPIGPYGQINTINFVSSDSLHLPLTRIVGELITAVRDDFNIPPPNLGFNPAFLLALAVPANTWNDQLRRGPALANVADGLPAYDVNRFVGPGVPHLPRRESVRQQMLYSAWHGAGTVVSRVIADGLHIRSLTGRPGAFRFRTDHRFGSIRAPQRNEPYVGNPLIVLTNVVAAPTAAGATALAADGVATANLTVASTVAGRTVNWTIHSGDIAVTAGNPAALPAAATLRAGVRSGRFRVRASDSIFPNRRINGRVRVAPVRLRRMRVRPRTLPAGTLATTVSLIADPGGRIVNWAVDAAAAAAGVTVLPAVTGPGAPAMNVTVTRPAGFSGRVTVTAADAVLAARTRSVRIRMR